MKNFILVICMMVFTPHFQLLAQELSAMETENIRSEVKTAMEQEQEAFKNGDCDKLITFFDEHVTFYANGREAPSVDFIFSFCKRAPRPFEKGEKLNDEIYVLSETAAYTTRIIEFKPVKEDSDTIKKEVVTKVWTKAPTGWKIVHFHSTIANVPRQ